MTVGICAIFILPVINLRKSCVASRFGLYKNVNRRTIDILQRTRIHIAHFQTVSIAQILMGFELCRSEYKNTHSKIVLSFEEEKNKVQPPVTFRLHRILHMKCREWPLGAKDPFTPAISLAITIM